MLCARTRSSARANDEKIVRSRDGQCNTDTRETLTQEKRLANPRTQMGIGELKCN